MFGRHQFRHMTKATPIENDDSLSRSVISKHLYNNMVSYSSLYNNLIPSRILDNILSELEKG